MRHLVDGRKFGINTSHRKAMFRSLAVNLVDKEQIVTTVEKAKELRRVVDRLVTLGKKGSLSAKRLVFARTRDRDVVQKVFGIFAERYAKRSGGYTRVLRLDDTRWGDGAEMALIEMVDRPIVEPKKKTKKTSKKEASAETGDGQHDHDHSHPEHSHKDMKKAAAGKVKSTATTNKVSKGAAKKTPVKSGGGRAGGSSS